MKYNVYSIQDTLVGYNAPFIMVSDEVAKREFTNSLTKNPNKEYLKLWKIAEFDEDEGTITSIPNELVMKGVDLNGSTENTI